jgi:hypothetical protein
LVFPPPAVLSHRNLFLTGISGWTGLGKEPETGDFRSTSRVGPNPHGILLPQGSSSSFRVTVMSQGLNNRGIAQIAIGAVCLASAWYLGQRTSANSNGVLSPPTADLKAEDLVWNAGPETPALSGGSVSPSPVVPIPALGETELARTGPMIVEPDFSSVPIAPALQAVSRPPLGGETFHSSPVEPNRDAFTGGPPAVADAGTLTTAGAQPALTPVGARDFDASRGVAESGFRIHVVRAGETLQSISGQYFGTADYYLDIYAANQDQLAGPSAGLSGLNLKIPVPHGGTADGG